MMSCFIMSKKYLNYTKELVKNMFCKPFQQGSDVLIAELYLILPVSHEKIIIERGILFAGQIADMVKRNVKDIISDIPY